MCEKCEDKNTVRRIVFEELPKKDPPPEWTPVMSTKRSGRLAWSTGKLDTHGYLICLGYKERLYNQEEEVYHLSDWVELQVKP